jgi:hypothetical protein
MWQSSTNPHSRAALTKYRILLKTPVAGDVNICQLYQKMTNIDLTNLRQLPKNSIESGVWNERKLC